MNADLLASEIRFWREMIEAMDENAHTRESAERMRQALALAEYRLAHLAESAPVSVEGKAFSPSAH